jgi:hypothetical protein
MDIFEVQFKVGDTSGDVSHFQPDCWEDGQIINVKSTGEWIPAATWWAWVNGHPIDDLPDQINNLNPQERPHWRRMRLRHRRFMDSNFSRVYHANQRFGTNYNAINKIPTSENKMLSQVEEALQVQINKINLYGGMDTNWGWKDLQHHGVVRVEMPPRKAQRLQLPYDDDTFNVFAPVDRVARAYWKIDYHNFLSAQVIADMQDDTLMVNVDRVSPATPLATATTKVIRDLEKNPEGPGDGVDP